MKIIKPVIKIGNKHIYNKKNLLKNRQKLDLYNEYENDNLDLWINNGQIKDNKCEKILRTIIN